MENKLQQYRKKEGFTQRETAKMLKIPFPTYRNYEYGYRIPSISKAKKIADLFGVKIDDIWVSESEE